METTVTHRVELRDDVAVLGLGCGHTTEVPRDDEEGLSFVGSVTDCQKCDPVVTLDYCRRWRRTA